MDREQEVIHKQMEETRSGLTDKLAALESQVGDTVQVATDAVETTKEAVTGTVEAVSGTVESVKDTVESVSEKVQETVAGVTDSVQQAVVGVKESVEETVKCVAESLNLKLQCERHPWMVFGGAVAVGYAGSVLLGGSARESRPATNGGVSHPPPERQQNSEPSSGNSVGSAVGGFFWNQLGNFKGLALGALMSVVREVVSKALPENLQERVSEEVDKLTKSLGGEPIKGSLLAENKEESEPSQGNGHEQQHHTNPWSLGKSETTAGRASQPAMAGNRR